MAVNIICNPVGPQPGPSAGPVAAIFDNSCCSTFAAPAQAVIGYTSAGNYNIGHTCSPNNTGAWLPSGANPADYEVKLVVVGGGNPDGGSPQVGTYHNLAASQEWAWSLNTQDSGVVIHFQLFIRAVGTAEPAGVVGRLELRLGQECI